MSTTLNFNDEVSTRRHRLKNLQVRKHPCTHSNQSEVVASISKYIANIMLKQSEAFLISILNMATCSLTLTNVMGCNNIVLAILSTTSLLHSTWRLLSILTVPRFLGYLNYHAFIMTTSTRLLIRPRTWTITIHYNLTWINQYSKSLKIGISSFAIPFF